MINMGTAARFGQWGERSIAESTMMVTNTKIERLEQIISSTDSLFLAAIDPSQPDRACDKWQTAVYDSNLVKAAFILDENNDLTAFYYRNPYTLETSAIRNLIQKEISPLIDKYDSLNQNKHLHRLINGEYYLITHLTVQYGFQDYIACLLYDTKTIKESLLTELLSNLGEERLANVVDDYNQPVFGQSIYGAEEFVVSRRFPFTLYKWRLQLAPTASALFSAQEKERARMFSTALLIPLALAVIVLGLSVLYLSVVRERRLNRLKSEFVANVTHELKTPLSLIRMFGELLYLGKVDDPNKTKHYYNIILRETDRLTSLIDNVLNLARIERGKSGYNFVEVDIVDAVEQSIEITRHALEKGIPLRFEVSGNRIPIRIDDSAITLAIVNLIDNAVKYATGTNFIGVNIVFYENLIKIDVIDQGVGIPHNQLKRIFDRFYRVPSKETSRQRGSGIGLSLVKHIIEGHGGTIDVSSSPKVETRFSIKIPTRRH